MIREKILRLQRHRSSSSSTGTDASGQKFDFTFSNIQALQVPKGWDKLSLSLHSSESGKTVRKSGKVSVKNGTCRWTESLSESIWVSDISDGSKEHDEYLIKFLVATGSSKSGILGETTLNLAAFLSSESPALVSLPLKKCNYGTTLQVEVRCLTPKANLRDEKWRDMHAHKDESADHDLENRSDVSESCSSNNCGHGSCPRELGSRETSFSASVCRYSFDSMDGSVGRPSFSSQNDRHAVNNDAFRRQDSIESNDNSSYNCSYSTNGSVKSVREQVINEREEFRKLPHALTAPKSLQQNNGSSKTLKDATVQELEAEARMWEQNARKLAVDLENLRKELSDQDLNMKHLNAELAKSRSECCELTREIECLKSLSEEEPASKQDVYQKELEDEMRFQKGANEDLSLQLKKTQESNIELISVFQEMEETIEKQKLELFSLQESGKTLKSEILMLESKLDDNTIATEIEQDLMNQILKECLADCNGRLAEKEQEIVNLVDASKELEHLKEKIEELEGDCSELTDENLQLLYELKELQKDVSKGSDASLISSSHDSSDDEEEEDPLKKREEAKAPSDYNIENIERDSTVTSDSLSNSTSDVILMRNSTVFHVSEDKTDDMRLMETESNETKWRKHLSDLEEENIYLSQRVSGLEAQLRYLTDKSEAARLDLQRLESQVRVLQNHIRRLEGEIESEKLGMNNRVLEMEKRWSEAEEECISLSTLNIRLQATTENLVEEYNSLEKYNGELREQKLKLQNKCMVLEAEARKFQDFSCNCAENMVKNDSKCKFIIDELESKIEISELERLRLAEENSVLNMHLEKVPELQNEVLSLRVSLKEMKFRYQLLEASCKSVSRDNEELKRENISVVEKISCLGKAELEMEDCRRKKNALEEKILRLEGDLIARDALCVQDAEMRNELNQIKIANTQLLTKLKCMEDAKEDLLRKVQLLEEELNQRNTDIQANQGVINPYQVQDCNKQEIIDSAETECKISVLEVELQEIRKRYLEISLKYAEVEAQREELVMKLKAINR